MGADCYLFTNGQDTYIGRWHVFSDWVVSGKEYTPDEMSKILDEVEKAKPDERYWVDVVRRELKDSPVIIWDEYEYLDKYYLPTFTR